MRRHATPAAALALALILGAAPAARAQVAVLSARSLESLRGDVSFLAELTGQDDLRARLDGYLKALGGPALEGADTQKPLGAYVHWPARLDQVLGFEWPVVFFLPVADEAKFLAHLGRAAGKPVVSEDGTHRVDLPGLPTRHFRFAHGYAYSATDPAALRGDLDPLAAVTGGVAPGADLGGRFGRHFLPAPASLLPPPAEQTALALSVRPGRIPPAGLSFLGESLGEFLGSADLAAGTEGRLKEALGGMPEALLGTARALREVRLSVDLPAGRKQLVVELAADLDAGAGVANALAHLGSAASRFGPLIAEAPAGGFLHIPGGGQANGEPGQIGVPLSRLGGSMFPPRYRARATQLMSVLIPTFGRDGVDLGLAMYEDAPETTTILVGLKVRDGRRFGHLWRDLYRDATLAEREPVRVEWNHASHAGVRIHKHTLVGEEDLLFLAFREDVVLAAFGKDPLPRLRRALDEFGKPPSPTPFVWLNVKGEYWRGDKDFQATLKKLDPKEELGKLGASFSIRGGEGLRLRLEASTLLIRTLGGGPMP